MKSTLKLLGEVYMFQHHYKIDTILKLIKYFKIKDVLLGQCNDLATQEIQYSQSLKDKPYSPSLKDEVNILLPDKPVMALMKRPSILCTPFSYRNSLENKVCIVFGKIQFS